VVTIDRNFNWLLPPAFNGGLVRAGMAIPTKTIYRDTELGRYVSLFATACAGNSSRRMPAYPQKLP
jgi:hypothetical protein